jgi:hypothetical protein
MLIQGAGSTFLFAFSIRLQMIAATDPGAMTSARITE